MTKQFFDAQKVRDAARGEWLVILTYLAPHLEEAVRKSGRHVPCPIHGGKDGFRLFKDAHLTGGGICNTCGSKADGISLLMWCNEWDFPTALQHIGGFLGVEPEPRRKSRNRDYAKATKPAKAKAAQKTDANEKKPLRCYVGRLSGYGAAPYLNKAENRESFYIELSLSSGEKRTLWGVGLKRPLKKAGADKGDFLGVQQFDREKIKLKSGKEVYRNNWSIEVLKSNSKSKPKAQEEVAIEPVEVERVKQSSSEQQPLEDQANIASIYQDKPWLAKVRATVEKRIAREEEYAKTLHTRIDSLWGQCFDLESNHAGIARMYLNARSLSNRGICSESLRFHPSLPYHDSDGNKLGDYPALVAAIRDVDGNIVTLHRTYLSEEGTKAIIPGGGADKKMMSIPRGLDVKGAAIRLTTPTNGVLGIAEGIETALSGYRATGIPAWAAVSAVLLENFEVPEDIHTIIIWADKDKSVTGERSAKVLQQRLLSEGISCQIMLPDMAIPRSAKSVDWNDVLVQQGIMGFPEPRRLRVITGFACSDK